MLIQYFDEPIFRNLPLFQCLPPPPPPPPHNVCFEKQYQTLFRVFHQISNHLEFVLKTRPSASFFNSLLGVWISDETLLVFDVLHQQRKFQQLFSHQAPSFQYWYTVLRGVGIFVWNLYSKARWISWSTTVFGNLRISPHFSPHTPSLYETCSTASPLRPLPLRKRKMRVALKETSTETRIQLQNI